MNSERNLLKRLLKLYPVKTIKEYFEISETGETLYNTIIRDTTPNLVRDFAYANIETTKQHIYIYGFAAAFNPSTFNLSTFPFPIIRHSTIGNQLRLIISPTVGFSVILDNPFEETTMNFYQPFIITVEERTLIFQATILEKNMASHFDSGRTVLKVQKENTEAIVIQQVLDYFNTLRPTSHDLNRGVKYLWNVDRIDSRYAKWKKNRSTATETMDENYTLKQQYPDIYSAMISSPLNKIVFRYLLNDDLFPQHFTIDPSKGEISVPLYPITPNQIQNVITEILSNN